MGIRGKLVLTTMLLACLFSAAPVAYLILDQRQLIHNEIEQQGLVVAESLSNSLAEIAASLDSINDTTSLQAATRYQDVLAAYAMHREGHISADGTKRNRREGQRIEEFDSVRQTVIDARSFVSQRKGGLVYISGPILVNGDVFGFVHLVLTLERADTVLATTLMEQAVIYAGVLVVGFLLCLSIFHFFRAPLRVLTNGLIAIRDGNYKVRMTLDNDDEMGQMGAIINEIADNFRSATISKRYLDEVLQSMVDTLIVVDTDANIVTVNRATMELLGYEEKQLVGQPASLVCIDEGYQLTGARLDHLLGDQTQMDHELQYRANTGTLIPISFSGSPIRDNTGEIVGYVCIGKDITDRKKAEKERDRLNKKLVETSRQAGMAEVATGVLHNVGNVLNSVNMSASMVTDTIRRSKVAGLNKAVEMINENREELGDFLTSDEKGKQIPHYLEQVAGHLADEQASIIGELNSLSKNIDHIKEIIGMQQSYSKVTGVIESVTLSEALDEALRLNAASLERNEVRVVRKVEYVPAIRTDKHKILQILVNLVSNAKDAMLDVEADKRALYVRIRKPEGQEGEQDFVNIEVQDTGCGIPQDNITRIFTHGFTTKKKGHGFGLHSAALSAKELGGSLTVTSDGVGHGATFTLSLPVEVGEPVNE